MSGDVTIAGHDLRAGQIAWSDPVPRVVVSAINLATGDGDEPSVIMAYSGQPIRQPVAMGGPFVMNSQAEIEQAFRDFHSGKFGEIPRQARLNSDETSRYAAILLTPGPWHRRLGWLVHLIDSGSPGGGSSPITSGASGTRVCALVTLGNCPHFTNPALGRV